MYNPEKEQKIQKICFVFQIIAFELGVANSDNIEQNILSSADNVLTNTPKTSPNSRADTFQVNFPDNDEKTW